MSKDPRYLNFHTHTQSVKRAPNKRPSTYLAGMPKLKQDHYNAFFKSVDRLKRHPLSTALTVMVIAIAIALPLGFLTGVKHLHQLSAQWQESLQVTLYLKPDLTEDAQLQLVNALMQRDDVSNINRISPDEGLALFQSRSEFGNLVEQLDTNPLPPVLEVYPRFDLISTQPMQTLAQSLQQLPQVDLAQLDQVWLQRLFSFMQFGDRLSFTLSIVFMLTIVFVVGNTLRLVLQSYQNEVSLMPLLGASRSYTQRPFLYLGTLYGVLGGCVAWLLLIIAMSFLQTPLNQVADLYGTHLNASQIAWHLWPLCLITGAVLTWNASWVVTHYYLD